MKERKMHPESKMMSYGYDPTFSEGSLKCPIFQTSTFVFKSAEEGKRFFEIAYNLKEKNEGEVPGLIYSRINNPDIEILENRLTLWDDAEDAAVFNSGMSAITTVLLNFLHPGDLILHSSPVYGGTYHFIHAILTKIGVKVLEFYPTDTKEDIIKLIENSGDKEHLKMIYMETPANPTNTLIDIQMGCEIADQYSNDTNKVIKVVDNTYMGPIWQHPLQLGADLVVYSATKYIGGHSDLIAGACLGNKELMKAIKGMRTFLGNMADAWTGWLLMRSLETLKLRMDKQAKNAKKVAKYLVNHPMVEKVYFPGLLKPEDGREYEIYKKQCLKGGAMISFEIVGGEKEAFLFLNRLNLINLAVS
ncbi:MAG: aminotransferase class I/II-fold pyridoxal phosphate-dependent enzyme, partial [Cyclobacteriaceae bacterium]|nr:aminotransferase class I/II-fold pyridoxal phosphate-dependent enzyme [Cyclobacteriaceae bacterium]